MSWRFIAHAGVSSLAAEYQIPVKLREKQISSLLPPSGSITGVRGIPDHPEGTITWTSYNMPASITQGARTVSFQHDDNHKRIKQVSTDGTTFYIKAFGVTAELFGVGTGAARWNDYLSMGNVQVGMRVTEVAAQTVSTRYFHTDHLGSVTVITNEAGAVVERLSYDAWGKRRYPNGTDDPTGVISSQTNRGFTGHEELDAVALVHMNGRVYDALVGRMISADPTVPDPMNAQAWNRYSYVGNDPLAFTDPSGFNWFSNFFRGIANFLSNNPIVRAIVQIVATAVLVFALGPAGLGLSGAALSATAAAGAAAITTGLSGGNLGQALRAGAIAGATAFAFFQVGDATNALANYNPVADSGMPAHIQPGFGTSLHAFNVAGHALVGCGSSVASGGSCASGALAAAAGAGAAPLMGGMNYTQRLVASAVVGGVGSVAGGGSFANGAVTGAFGYMFNQAFPAGMDLLSRISPAEAMGLSVQQDVMRKTEETSQNVSFVGGGQVEGTGITGGQLSAGIFVTLSPFDFGVFGSAGWMSGVSAGAGLFGGGVIGGVDTLRGTAGAGGVSSPFGGVSTTTNSNNQITGLYWSSPAPRAGASGGFVNTCTASLRGVGC